MLCAAALLTPVGPARAAAPGDDEQLMLEMLNRLRWNPAAELHVMANIDLGPPATWGLTRSSDPAVHSALVFFDVDADTLASQWATLTPRVAPLAWNNNLHNAAAGHNQFVIEYDRQSHQLPGEPDLGQRLRDAGYNFITGAENVYAYADSVFYGHAGFAIDWGPGPGGIQDPAGHRVNMMNPGFREVGIAIAPESVPETQVGPLVITQDFGRRSGNAFLTGVLYDETEGAADYFYTPGEGLGAVNVQAFTAGSATLRGSTTSTASGGYNLQIAAGTYDLKFSGGELGNQVITYRNVAVGTSNVKVDNLTSFIAASGADWHAVTNWSAGVPNGPGTTAVLGRTIPGQQANVPRAVNVTAPVTVGRIVFDAANPVTVGGAGAVTLDGGAGGAASLTALPTDDGTTHTIATPLSFAGAVTRDGAGTLTVGGPQQHQPGALLLIGQGRTRFLTNAGSPAARTLGVAAVSEGATASFAASQDLVRLDVQAGARVTLERHGGRVVAMNGFSSLDGTLDLTDNAALVDYELFDETTAVDVRDAVTSAYARGAWTGTGITSSVAAGQANAAVGYARSADVFDYRLDRIYTFFDRVVDETTMLVRYTLEGDADLDGAVTFTDFLRLRDNLTSEGEWSGGDFDYDGRVTARDYALLRRNFGAGVGGAVIVASASEWAAMDAFGAVVPEPATPALLLLAGGTVSLLRRRRAEIR